MKRFETAKDFHLRRIERKARHAADALRRAVCDRQVQELRAAMITNTRRSQSHQAVRDSAVALLLGGVAMLQKKLDEPNWELAPETLAFEAWQKQQGHR